jgi:hypothetical protein
MRQHSSIRGPALGVVFAAALVAGCSHTPAPTTEQMGSTRGVIEVAQAAGATDASPEMALARDKLAQAEAANKAKDYTRARQLAEEAEVDALVARSKVASEKSRKAADELDASLAALRSEMTRQPGALTTPINKP